LVSEAEQTAEKIEDSVEAIESKKRIRLPKVTSITEDEVASIDLPDVTDIPDAVRSVYNELPDIKDISEPEPVPEPEPVYQQEAVEPVQEPAPVSGVSGSLAEFETAMRDLKRRKAEGLISDSEFAAEKKKLMQMI
ncbi:MAG: SHOCT domain-containing protein, partial [Oscillospiraceae bacterium]|nr:SHOCT domain-containing protein [Oscillospiraceae bacterium]